MQRHPIEKCWLYAVASPNDLARRLSTKHPVTVGALDQLARDAGNYRVFVTKKGRRVQQPRGQLQRLHRYVHDLLSRLETPAYLHSAVRGRSYITNAAAHDPFAPSIKIDVKKFFASVPRSSVYRFFVGPMRCSGDVAGLLANLLTYDCYLPTGSSSSPIIAYYAFKPMFDEIEGLARSEDLLMTCYVDDMTLTGRRASRRVLQAVRCIIARHGLRSHKIRFLAGSRPKVITGVAVTRDGPRLPNRRHRAISHSFAEYRAAPDPSSAAKAFRKLIGRMHEAGQIEPHWSARARTLKHEPSSTS